MFKKMLFVLAGLAVGGGLVALLSPQTGVAQKGEVPTDYQPTTEEIISQQQVPNADILVNKDVGEWMVCVASYTGEKAHIMARNLVAELRSDRYKLPAYVFNHGAEKRRKEEERVAKLKQQQIELLKKVGHTGNTKIRVRTMNLQEQVAVLIGGYRDMKTARNVADALKKLPKLDPKRVAMDLETIVHKDEKTGKVELQGVFVDPFTHGIVVRNPTFPKANVQHGKDILRSLQKLNANEPYSLLKNPKKFTLAVKEFRMPTIVQQERGPKTFLGKLGLINENSTGKDHAGVSAHNLAKLMRDHMKLDAYVLHSGNYSVVTVGGFDSREDPRVRLMQERLAREFARMESAFAVQNNNNRIGFYPVPVPFPVPR